MELKEWSAKIRDNLTDLKVDLENKKKSLAEEINITTVDLREAASKGDLSENAEFSSAVEKLSLLNVQLNNVDLQYKAVCNAFSKMDYTPVGIVVMYSTVRLVVDGEREFIFKLYPGEVSDIERHILSVSSPVGRAIFQRGVGDVVKIDNRSNGVPVKYLIKEIY